MLYWYFLLSLSVSENAWNPDPYVCTAICLVWPVSARNIRKWLGNWFLCITGSGHRRRWSGKTSALHSALFHVESSLEALSPLGAGCWYSYTHTLQQQSSPGWTAGNSLSWQNSAFWQDSLLQQCLPVPAEGAAAAQLWQHECSVLLPFPAQPCWFGIIHLIETPCASGRPCSHFILSTLGPSLAAKAQSEHSLSHPTLLQTLVSFHIHCLLMSWFSHFSFPVYSVLSLFISKGMSSCCQSRPLTAVGAPPWTSPQRCQCSSRQGLGLGPFLDALLPLFISPRAFT